MTWLKQLSSDDMNRLSSTRVIALMAGSTLCFSTAVLTVGSFWHPEMLPVLSAIGPSLAGMATASYMMNRWATKEVKNEPAA